MSDAFSASPWLRPRPMRGRCASTVAPAHPSDAQRLYGLVEAWDWGYAQGRTGKLADNPFLADALRADGIEDRAGLAESI